MSTRQARRERRESERRAKKAEIRREKALSVELNLPNDYAGTTAAAAAAIDEALPTGLIDLEDEYAYMLDGIDPEPIFAAAAAPARKRLDAKSPRVLANRANAQHSTGPKSDTGKATASQNNFRHGLTGTFKVLPSESQSDFDALIKSFAAVHEPTNECESSLIQKMAEHFWLAQRALFLQETCFNATGELSTEQKKDLALYMRYHTTHDRAFYKYSEELRKLRNERRKAAIGFESLERKRAEETRREAAENRKQELHKWTALLAQSKAEYQESLTNNSRRPNIAPIAAFRAA